MVAWRSTCQEGIGWNLKYMARMMLSIMLSVNIGSVQWNPYGVFWNWEIKEKVRCRDEGNKQFPFTLIVRNITSIDSPGLASIDFVYLP